MGRCLKVDDQNINGWIRIRLRKLPLLLTNDDEREGMIGDNRGDGDIFDSQGVFGRPESTDLYLEPLWATSK